MARLRGSTPSGVLDAEAVARNLDPQSFDDVVELVDLCASRGLPPETRHTLCTLLISVVGESGNRKLFLPLVRALKGCDPASRQALVRAIPLVNDPRSHRELAALLHQKDPALRGAAAQVLASVGGHTVLDILGEDMLRRSYAGRAEAIDVVVRVAGHRSIPALVACISVASAPDKHRMIRYLADASYMAADRVGALATLRLLLTDPDDAVVSAAIRAFGELGTEEEWFDHVGPALDNSSLQVVLAGVESLRHFRGPRVITVLHGRLRAGPKALRLAVLDTLLAIGTDRVLPVVVVGLSHEDLPVRTRAGEVLAEMGTRGNVDIAHTVLWLLRSPDAPVRRMAVGVARSVRDPGATLWPRLFELLRDEDWWVRERVADALIALAGRKMLGHLAGLLHDPEPPIRMFAVDVLGRLGDKQGVGALVRIMMDDSDWWVRERAMESLASLGDARVSPFLARIISEEPGMRVAALDALGRLKAREEASMVARLLSDPQPDVRFAALRCLEQLDDPRVAHSLRVVAEDANVEVRDLARQLQVRWRARLNLDPSVWIPSMGSPLDRLLLALIELGADDMVLAPGQPPLAKRLGKIVPLDPAIITSEKVAAMILPILSATQLEDLQARRDVDLSYEIRSTGARFRANVFHQIHGTGVVFRVVHGDIPSIAELGLPAQVAELTQLSNGLVLVGGATGSGKSTTISALIDRINRSQPRHIITLEDPIEVVHAHHVGIVNQREIGHDTGSYGDALRATLREDPDVILVGELRDLETIRFAVTAAETGHLVFGTVHTVAADTTVDRLINIFPTAQQEQVRAMLAGSLRAVVCQNLLPCLSKDARVLACEIMFNTGAISNLIRQGKSHQLLTTISTSQHLGMQTMDGELLRLVGQGVISAETAYLKARSKQDFQHLLDVSGDADGDTNARAV